jgi:hypothetical protein
VAVADYFEDLCHLRYLSLHEAKRVPSLVLTTSASLVTSIKFAGFVPAFLITLYGMAAANWQLLFETPDWRSVAVLLLALLFIFVFAVYVSGLIVHAITGGRSKREKRKKTDDPPPDLCEPLTMAAGASE